MSKYTTTTEVKNGVKVKITKWVDGGRVVEADCQCFGHPFRTHSNPCCPNLKAKS